MTILETYETIHSLVKAGYTPAEAQCEIARMNAYAAQKKIVESVS